MLRKPATLLCCAAALAAAGCDSPIDPPAPDSSPRRAATPIAGPPRPQTLDELWAALAEGEVPGFAGHRLDAEGRSVVYVANGRPTAPARAYVEGFRRSRGLAASAVRVVPVQYNSAQLKGWHDALLELLGSDAVISIDIAEDENRVVIGVRDGAAVGFARREAAARGIPNAAVDARVVERPVPRQNLQSSFRPVPGGVGSINSVTSQCTIGFNVVYTGGWYTPESTRAFVTASHCSSHSFASDVSVQYQPELRSASLRIGQEYLDAPKASCNWMNICFSRGSDAAIFKYDDAVGSELGYLARPQLPVGIGGRGSLNLDATNPRFAITMAASKYMGEPVIGDWLNKVGRTSGWTRGQVTQTCVTISGLICQYVSSIWSEGGDSGSPIFADESNTATPAGTNVKLHGILWGGPYGNWNVTWHSHLSEIAWDLGFMNVCVPGNYC
ncbi:MAG TPA: hypothetical protein VFX98_01955 [Longimicrobiaceae bacterium]|nr:hypothetical protein [Longimicrobiaceae bacterium]